MTFEQLPDKYKAEAKRLTLDYMNQCEEEAASSNGTTPIYYSETDAVFLEQLAVEDFQITVDQLTKKKYVSHD